MCSYVQYVNDGPWTYLKLHKCVRMSRGLLLFCMSHECGRFQNSQREQLKFWILIIENFIKVSFS